MARLTVFNNVSVDGHFVDGDGAMGWAHAGAEDAEFQAFIADNASGDGVLVFGRVTYEMMAGFWPTPAATQRDASVAARMNSAEKLVFSRTLERAAWNNTTLVKDDMIAELRRRKQGGKDLVILGSGAVVAQVAQAGLVDDLQLVVNPVVLGAGRTLFDGCQALGLRLLRTRAFANGKVLLCYGPGDATP